MRHLLVLITVALITSTASAHRSGCHRWHSCPSDSGSNVCGDLGYSTYCPKKPTYQKPTSYSDRQVIVDIQTNLRRLNYEVGKADGIAGPQTEAAIRSFQKRPQNDHNRPIVSAIT